MRHSAFILSFNLSRSNLLNFNVNVKYNPLSYFVIMLTKSPKPAYKRYILSSLKAVLLFEAAGLAASYGLWYKLNSDRDFRLFMYKNYNWALEGYYGIGEKFGNQKTREIDFAYWRSEGKI